MGNIKNIKLENFKSHKDTIVDFSDGLSVIIGATNSGKTAIIDGIRWCLYNEPTGDKFKRHGAPYVRVEIEFDDGRRLIRERGDILDEKSVNRYIIVYPDGEKVLYSNFGSKVPESVVEFHGMPKMKLFDAPQSINIAEQFEPPFFLGESQQSQARMIGNLANVEVLDLARRNIDTDLRAANKRRREIERDSKDKQKELESLSDIDSVEAEKDRIVKKFKEIQEENLRLGAIQRGAKKLEELTDKLTDVEKIIKLSEEVEAVYSELSEIDRNATNLVTISKVANSLDALKSKLRKILDIEKKVSLEDISGIEKSISNLHSESEKHSRLKEVYSDFKNLKEELPTINRVVEVEPDLHGITKDIKAAKDVLTGEIEPKSEILKRAKSIASELDEYKERKLGIESDILDNEKELENSIKEYEQIIKDNEVCPVCNTPAGDIDFGSMPM